MERSELLGEISEYCRKAGLAESTFGRKAVNDGKLVGRIRDGGRISAGTWQRIQTFMRECPPETHAEQFVIHAAGRDGQAPASRAVGDAPPPVPPQGADNDQNFRFFDNRQKYLMFVNTVSEKWVVAQRVALELAHLHPRPPSVRVFDAGVGDGSVLSRVMRAMHHRFPTMPFYIVGKEISLEDIRLTLDKMPDRFFEHPATVLVLTNLYYSEAPWLITRSTSAASSFVWKEVALRGASSHDFENQIAEIQPFLAENWQARIGKSGNPIYERPVVVVIYREDHRFLLNQVIPERGSTRADYDLVVASQPYRARASAEFKAKKVLAPLARALGPGGRLIGIHSCGGDPGMEIVHKIWPDDHPFQTDRHALLKAVKSELGADGSELNFNAYSDNRAIFRYHMHTLPNEVSSSIGTSTLFAAWNAAVYVAQVEDERLESATITGAYIDGTREVLQRHGGLWFNDESYVISRRRD